MTMKKLLSVVFFVALATAPVFSLTCPSGYEPNRWGRTTDGKQVVIECINRTTGNLLVDFNAMPSSVSKYSIADNTANTLLCNSTVTVSGTGDGITVGNGAAILGQCGVGSNATPITPATGANLTSVITNKVKTGAGQQFFSFSGAYIKANPLATVSGAMVDLQSIFEPSFFKDSIIGGRSNTLLVRIRNNSDGAGFGPFEFYNNSLNCYGLSGCQPLLVQSLATGGYMSTNFTGGEWAHSGTGKWNAEFIGSANVTSYSVGGIYIEGSNGGAGGVNFQNLTGLTVNRILCGGYNNGDCVRISESSAGLFGDAVLMGIQNASWTNTINNTIDNATITDAFVPLYVRKGRSYLPTIAPPSGKFVHISPTVSGSTTGGAALVEAEDVNHGLNVDCTATGARADSCNLTNSSLSRPNIALNVSAVGSYYFMFAGGWYYALQQGQFYPADTSRTLGHKLYHWGSFFVDRITTQSTNNDLAGKLTLSSGSASLTFSTAYDNAPVCVATDTTAAAAVKVATTTTTLTVTGTGSDVVNYICMGR